MSPNVPFAAVFLVKGGAARSSVRSGESRRQGMNGKSAYRSPACEALQILSGNMISIVCIGASDESPTVR